MALCMATAAEEELAWPQLVSLRPPHMEPSPLACAALLVWILVRCPQPHPVSGTSAFPGSPPGSQDCAALLEARGALDALFHTSLVTASLTPGQKL